MTQANPTPGDAAVAMVATARLAVSGPVIGQVDSWDGSSSTCTVTPTVQMVRQLPDGSVVATPVPTMSGVPICYPSGGGTRISWRLVPGDMVTLIPRQYSHDELDAGATDYPIVPSSTRLWNAADWLAIPAYHPPARTLSTASVAPSVGDVLMEIPSGGSLIVGDAIASVIRVATDTAVRAAMQAQATAYATHTHPYASGVTGTPSTPLPVPSDVGTPYILVPPT